MLEVNAASNRNGKRILDELQEATQSHRVKRSSIFDKSNYTSILDHYFRKKFLNFLRHINFLSHILDVKKSKKKKKASTEEKKTMSLILIEDVSIYSFVVVYP